MTAGEGERKIEKILYPTDGSTTAGRAMHFAVYIAKATRAKIIVLSVGELPFLHGAQSGLESQVSSQIKRVAQDVARKAKREVAGYGIEAQERTEIGDPAGKIVEVAKKEKVDAIVMGTQGTTGLARVIIGSVADRVIREADCPVILVPLKGARTLF
ncbi:MAG: universal stress protein [Actinomycetota bacterium]|nr:universal stress protein [Actinomycetota bacterium]